MRYRLLCLPSLGNNVAYEPPSAFAPVCGEQHLGISHQRTTPYVNNTRSRSLPARPPLQCILLSISHSMPRSGLTFRTTTVTHACGVTKGAITRVSLDPGKGRGMGNSSRKVGRARQCSRNNPSQKPRFMLPSTDQRLGPERHITSAGCAAALEPNLTCVTSEPSRGNFPVRQT